ncbi:unnamed protein product [Timema podura]|uniref:Peptidase S1 domain-containing protein n=1 Tax=Timema podura TaxID=61482 RepID=A0ABN7NT94_TIMPD|nr:unnamed protein product [Timema podura]
MSITDKDFSLVSSRLYFQDWEIKNLSLELDGLHICAATAIGDYWALTVAHCVTDAKYSIEITEVIEYNVGSFPIPDIIQLYPSTQRCCDVCS